MKSRTRIFGLALCVLASVDARAAAPPEAGKPPPGDAAATERQIRTHALAFSGILDSQNGYLHSTLDVTLDPAEAKGVPQAIRRTLGESWEVGSREELIALLTKIETGENGHRQNYWAIRRELLTVRMENYLQVMRAVPLEKEAAQVFVVATHLGPLRGKTLPITAWDFGRYIFLCRMGYIVGWLTEEEAWSRIIPAARFLQASYGSWS